MGENLAKKFADSGKARVGDSILLVHWFKKDKKSYVDNVICGVYEGFHEEKICLLHAHQIQAPEESRDGPIPDIRFWDARSSRINLTPNTEIYVGHADIAKALMETKYGGDRSLKYYARLFEPEPEGR